MHRRAAAGRGAGAAAAAASALLAAAVLAAAAGGVAARGASFVVQSSSFRITRPSEIAGAFDAAIGDFGVPLYGGTLSGSVVYGGSFGGNGLGCQPFGAPLPAGALPTVLLVDRGDCFFVQKAMHGQRAGAQAVLVTDHTEERLLTMAVPEDHPDVAALVPDIKIPVVLVTKSTGDRIKSMLAAGGSAHGEVEVEMDWKESIAHPDDRVEWELWMTSQDACGPACDSMRAFLQSFQDTATSLEQEHYTQFTPHAMVRACHSWLPKPECDKSCIHRGRYCSIYELPDKFKGQYNGAKVVEQNKRHLCAFQVANETQHEPWRWWSYAAGFAGNCTMAAGRYDARCAEEQLRAAGLDVVAVAGCMGASDSDAPHPVMEAQLAAQVDAEGSGRGRVILLPTVVINTDQYRGSLAAPAVLRALCAGFSEGSEPPICLSGSLNVDDCASGADACWRGADGAGHPLSACVDTFRGYVCRCPGGWEGDGRHCQDIDECALHIDGCDQVCVNTPGSYRCECHKGYTLHGGQGAPGMCIPSSLGRGSRLPAWLLALLVVASVVGVSLVGMFAYRWRLRQEMQAEIHSIMKEYLPLGATDAETAALGESLLRREGSRSSHGGGGGGNGGSSRGGTPRTPRFGRKARFADSVGGGESGTLQARAVPLYAGVEADVEGGGGGGGGEGPFTPRTPATPRTPGGSRLPEPPPLTEMTDMPSPRPRSLGL